ncbi:MAG TPA: hypothetical protein VMS76_06925 [Planctomycetota bacterium]|nr:hypothetical protein [Planctomycetota bacterium]
MIALEASLQGIAAPGCASHGAREGGPELTVRVQAPGAQGREVELAGVRLGRRQEEGSWLDVVRLEESGGVHWLERGVWKGIEGSPVYDSSRRRMGLVVKRYGSPPSCIVGVAELAPWLSSSSVSPGLADGIDDREQEGALELGTVVGIARWTGSDGGVWGKATVATLGPAAAVAIPWQILGDPGAWVGAAVVAWTPHLVADHGDELELVGRPGKVLGVVAKAAQGALVVHLDRGPEWIDVRCSAWAGDLELGRCEARVAVDSRKGWTRVPALVAHHLSRCDLRRPGVAELVTRSSRWDAQSDLMEDEFGRGLDKGIAARIESLLRGGDGSAPRFVECEVRLIVSASPSSGR